MGLQRIRHNLATEQQQQGATKSPWGLFHWASWGEWIRQGQREVRRPSKSCYGDSGERGRGPGPGRGSKQDPKGQSGAPGSVEYELWLQAAPWAAEAGGGATPLLCLPAAQAEPSRAERLVWTWAWLITVLRVAGKAQAARWPMTQFPRLQAEWMLIPRSCIFAED